MKMVLIVLVALAVIAGVGGGAYLLISRQPSEPVATPVPTASPAVQPQVQPTLTLSSGATLTPGQPNAIDVILDTKGLNIDGFQFIATVTGPAGTTIQDASDTLEGVQIASEVIDTLTVTTNSIATQDGSEVVRFAMITQTGVESFSTSTPTKIASITIIPAGEGTVTVAFNPQNSRASITGGGQDALIAVEDSTFTISAATAAEGQTATASATQASTQTAKSFASCQLSCLTDNDCDAGLTCNAGICANSACLSSTTCVCGTTTTALTSTTTSTSSATTSTGSALLAQVATPTPTPISTTTSSQSSVASDSALAEDLPVSGSMETTLLLLAGGFFFLGAGVLLFQPAKTN